MKRNKIFFYYFLILILSIMLTSCALKSTPTNEEPSVSKVIYNDEDTLRIVAGSENKELEPILEEFTKEHKINVQMEYLGSLDIMRMLQREDVEYDGVWPASTMWLSLGDTSHILKHTEVTSISPVVFGIKKSLAEELNFVGREVTVEEIIQSIESGKLKFAMTSATQSNSGASAYLGFLTAIANNPEGLTSEDLQNPQVQEQITKLLNGVNRSSGSSNWLVDLFLEGNYDAMVNYETLIIKTNTELEKQNKEPLYMIYPVDGVSISDSPLAYVDKGNEKKEEMFLKLQEYLLSESGQDKIEKTGRRSAYGTINKQNEKVFKSDWGIDISKVISPIRLPKADVIEEALSLYQSSFKKPSLTIYVLDFSGSMAGEGHEQLMLALEQVLVPENAQKNLLLGTSKDYTYLMPFSNGVLSCDYAIGNSEQLRALYDLSKEYQIHSGTELYEATIEALKILKDHHSEDIEDYTPASVLLTDGMANGSADIKDLSREYRMLGRDVPIFSIMFGDASGEQLSEIAKLSRARVFDGREDLIKAFQTVKGYN